MEKQGSKMVVVCLFACARKRVNELVTRILVTNELISPFARVLLDSSLGEQWS